MGDKSKIPWTDATWNILVGCTHKSSGCDHCYAARQASRPLYEGWMGSSGVPLAEQGRWSGELRFFTERLSQPLRWRKPRRIFVNSMGDTFHGKVPDILLGEMFGVMGSCPEHVFQVLTKRIVRAKAFLDRAERIRRTIQWEGESELPGLGAGPWPLSNVWLGVTLEHPIYQRRIAGLLECRAAHYYVSCEPLLGAVDMLDAAFTGAESLSAMGGIGWVIVGGESGSGARRMDPDWARRIRDQCLRAEVPFFFKQAGAVLAKEWGCSDRKGEIMDEWPEDLRIQQWPEEMKLQLEG